jgi:hypothetical protein
MNFKKSTPTILTNQYGRFAEQILALLLVVFLSQNMYAQTTDLSINMVNYDENETTTNDTLWFEFNIENNGTVTYPAGDTLYGNLELNGIVLSLDLLGFAPSPIILPEELAPGGSITLNYGYLLASQTIPFIPGATDSLGVCLILWGDDIANIANFGGDANPQDNKTCFSYLIPEVNWSISMVNYDEGETITSDTILPVFRLTNLGNVTYSAGDTVWMNASFNGQVFSLNLASSNPTGVELPIDIAPGESVELNPGYLLGPLVLPFFPGADEVEICLIIWGEDFDNLNNYSSDVDNSDNTTCVTYAEPMPDLSIDMVQYDEGEISSNDTLKFEFTITNNGNITYPEGVILYGNVEFNGIQFSLDLAGTAPSPIPLPTALEPGQSVTINLGILSASLTLPFIPGATDSLGICMILWGDDLANINNYGGDINTANNRTCFSYKAMGTATEDILNSNHLSIYPNPANRLLTVEFNGETSIAEFAITDINGRKLAIANTPSTQQQLDVSQLADGIYIVKARLENQQLVVAKMMVKH